MNSVTTAIKEKYPDYADVPDDELTRRIGEKYPQYLDHEDFSVDFKRLSGGAPAEASGQGDTATALGAAGRAAGTGLLPSLAAAIGGAGGYAAATPFAPETGGLSYLVPLAGTVLGAILGSTVAEKGQKAVLKAAAPEAAKRLEQLQQADIQQHPWASFGGSLIPGAAAFEVSPGQTIKGAAAAIKAARGGALTAEELQHATGAAMQAGLGAATGVVSPLLEGQTPTAQGITESTAQALIFGHPRIKALRAGGGRRIAAQFDPLTRARELASKDERTPAEDAELAKLNDFLTKRERTQNASEIRSPETETQPDVRTQVGEETRVRQQGETAGAGAPEETTEAPPKPILRPVLVVPTETGDQRFYGATHDEAVTAARDAGVDVPKDNEALRGFETPAGAVLDRAQAAKVFEEATGNKPAKPGELHSEDLIEAAKPPETPPGEAPGVTKPAPPKPGSGEPGVAVPVPTPAPEPVTVGEKPAPQPWRVGQEILHTDPASKVGRVVTFKQWLDDGTALVIDERGRHLSAPPAELSAKPVKRGTGTGGLQQLNKESEQKGDDILSYLGNEMKMISAREVKRGPNGTKRWKAVKGQWDDAPGKLQAVHHNAIYGGTTMPAEAAEAAFRAGWLKEPTVTALWQAIDKASKGRAGKGEGITEADLENRYLAQEADWKKSTAAWPGRIPVAGEALHEGDILVIDGERMTVGAQEGDGSWPLKGRYEEGGRFGPRSLDESGEIYATAHLDKDGKPVGEEPAPPAVEPSKPEPAAPQELAALRAAWKPYLHLFQGFSETESTIERAKKFQKYPEWQAIKEVREADLSDEGIRKALELADRLYHAEFPEAPSKPIWKMSKSEYENPVMHQFSVRILSEGHQPASETLLEDAIKKAKATIVQSAKELVPPQGAYYGTLEGGIYETKYRLPSGQELWAYSVPHRFDIDQFGEEWIVRKTRFDWEHAAQEFEGERNLAKMRKLRSVPLSHPEIIKLASEIEPAPPEAKPAEAKGQTLDTRIAAAKQEVADAYNGLKKMGLKPLGPEDQIRFYKSLYDLAKLYIEKGVKTAEEFAAALGQKVNAYLTKAWDDASAGRPEETDAKKLPMLTQKEAAELYPPRTTTQVMGERQNIGSRPGGTVAGDVRSIQHGLDVITQAGDGLDQMLKPAARGTFTLDPDGFTHEAGGHRLIELIQDELPANWEGNEDGAPMLTPLFQSIRQMFHDAKSGQQSTLVQVFGEPIARRLYGMTQGTISHWGMMLQSLQKFGDSLYKNIVHDPLVHLQLEWGKMYGGASYDAIFKRVMNDIAEKLGVAWERIRNLQPTDPDYGKWQNVIEMVDASIQAKSRDSGGRVYRIIQGLFKPKAQKKLERLLADTRFQEAVDEVIEQLHAQGVEPKKPPGKTKLDPMEKLTYLANPEVGDKVDAAIKTALWQAERKAARELFRRDAGLTEEDMIDYDARTADPAKVGPDPLPEHVDKGLDDPQFRHWRAFKANLADYSPVTLALARRVLQGDFKGTKFTLPPAKVADMRIDLNKLAKAPEAEVKRVLEEWRLNLNDSVYMAGATDETRMRIDAMMSEELAAQLQARKAEHLERFFSPKQFTRATPSEKLKALVNLGVEKDARFKGSRVQELVRKLVNIPAKDFEEQAVKTRDEKNGWVADQLDKLSKAEGWDKLSDDTRGYFEAVAFSKLAERLSEAEGRITRRFLGGSDTTYGPKPVTLREAAARRDDQAAVLRGKINAGALDTDMVEDIAKKAAVTRLLPKMTDMVKQILEVPYFKQDELKQRFIAQMVDKLKVDPAQTDKLWETFSKAFDAKLQEAKLQASQKALNSLTDKERRVVESHSMHEKLKSLINAGNNDFFEAVQEVARRNKQEPPAPAAVEALRAQGERLMRHETLSEADMERLRRTVQSGERGEQELKMEPSEQEVATALEVKMEANKNVRTTIIRDIQTKWLAMTKQLGLSGQGARNVRDAAQEYLTLNLLVKPGHLVRFPIHLGTQAAFHYSFRPLAKAFEVAHARAVKAGTDMGRWTLPSWEEVYNAYSQQLQAGWAARKAAWAQGRAELFFRGEGRDVDKLRTGTMIVERIAAKAKAYADAGNYPMATLTWLFNLPRYAGASISIVDQWQGKPAVWADMLAWADLEMANRGDTQAARHAFAERYLHIAKHEIEDAVAETATILHASGEEVTPKQIEENAWNLVQYRLTQLMKNTGLASDAIQERVEALRKQLAWQDEVRRGVGGVVAAGVRTVGKLMPAMGAFSNAIGHGINWSLWKLPPGVSNFLAEYDFLGRMGGAKASEPSAMYRTEMDKRQRTIESIAVMAGTGLIGGLLLSRQARYNPYFANAQQRGEMEREGRKPGTIDFELPDGSRTTWSLIVGPMTIFAPMIAPFGAWANLIREREQAQAKLNAEAAKRGLPPGKIPDISPLDYVGVGAHAFWASVMGGRTAAGFSAQMWDPMSGFNARRFVSSQISPLLVGVPGYQEISRMMGVNLDKHRAGVLDYMIPLPTSGARMVNVLGDPLGTRDGARRVMQVLTGGSAPIPYTPEPKQDAAYGALIGSGYHPPAVAPNKGFAFEDGTFRPMTGQELEAYSVNRGKALKAKLAAIGPGATHEQASAAFAEADQEALASVGASKAGKLAAAGGTAGRGGRGRRATTTRGAARGRVGRLTRGGAGGRLRTRASRLSGFSSGRGLSLGGRKRRRLV